MSGFSACFLEGLSGICEDKNGFCGYTLLQDASANASFLMYKDNKGFWGMDFTIANKNKTVYVPFDMLKRKYLYEIPKNMMRDLRKDKTIGHPGIWIMDNNGDIYEAKNLNDYLFLGFGACLYPNVPKRGIIDLKEIIKTIEDIVKFTYETAKEEVPDRKMMIYPDNLIKTFEGKLPIPAYFSQNPDEISNIFGLVTDSPGEKFVPKKIRFKDEKQ